MLGINFLFILRKSVNFSVILSSKRKMNSTIVCSFHCTLSIWILSTQDSYVHSPGHLLRKMLKHWSRRLYLAVWTTATRFSMEWPIMSWGESSRCRMLQHASSPEPDVVSRDHITPVLCQIHWLPVRRRVEFKLACLVRQALCGQMPIYLADDIHLVSGGNRRSLRSSSDNMCAVPRTHNSFGDRSFGAVGPRIWNSLPRCLRTLDISYKHFKALLKTYMFRQGTLIVKIC